MGILEGLARFITGKPIYKDEDVTVEERQTVATMTPDMPVEDVVPIVRIDNVRSSVDDDYLEVHGDIHNDSKKEVELEKIEILGKVGEQNARLAAGKTVQNVRLFAGEAPDIDRVDTVILTYRAAGDGSFQAKYTVESRQEVDGRRSITGISLQLPVHEA